MPTFFNSSNIRRYFSVAIAILFTFNSISWAVPLEQDTLRPISTGQKDKPDAETGFKHLHRLALEALKRLRAPKQDFIVPEGLSILRLQFANEIERAMKGPIFPIGIGELGNVAGKGVYKPTLMILRRLDELQKSHPGAGLNQGNSTYWLTKSGMVIIQYKTPATNYIRVYSLDDRGQLVRRDQYGSTILKSAILMASNEAIRNFLGSKARQPEQLSGILETLIRRIEEIAQQIESSELPVSAHNPVDTYNNMESVGISLGAFAQLVPGGPLRIEGLLNKAYTRLKEVLEEEPVFRQKIPENKATHLIALLCTLLITYKELGLFLEEVPEPIFEIIKHGREIEIPSWFRTSPRQMAINALVAIGPAAVPGLDKLFSEGDYSIKSSVVFICEQMGPAGIPVLVRALDDDEVAYRAVHALLYSGDRIQRMAYIYSPGIPLRLKALAAGYGVAIRFSMDKDKKSDIRGKQSNTDLLLKKIEAFKDKSSIFDLVSLVGNERGDIRIRTQTAFLLGEIGPRASSEVPALRRLLKVAEEPLKRHIALAISKIEGDQAAREHHPGSPPKSSSAGDGVGFNTLELTGLNIKYCIQFLDGIEHLLDRSTLMQAAAFSTGAGGRIHTGALEHSLKGMRQEIVRIQEKLLWPHMFSEGMKDMSAKDLRRRLKGFNPKYIIPSTLVFFPGGIDNSVTYYLFWVNVENFYFLILVEGQPKFSEQVFQIKLRALQGWPITEISSHDMKIISDALDIERGSETFEKWSQFLANNPFYSQSSRENKSSSAGARPGFEAIDLEGLNIKYYKGDIEDLKRWLGEQGVAVSEMGEVFDKISIEFTRMKMGLLWPHIFSEEMRDMPADELRKRLAGFYFKHIIPSTLAFFPNPYDEKLKTYMVWVKVGHLPILFLFKGRRARAGFGLTTSREEYFETGIVSGMPFYDMKVIAERSGIAPGSETFIKWSELLSNNPFYSQRPAAKSYPAEDTEVIGEVVTVSDRIEDESGKGVAYNFLLQNLKDQYEITGKMKEAITAKGVRLMAESIGRGCEGLLFAVDIAKNAVLLLIKVTDPRPEVNGSIAGVVIDKPAKDMMRTRPVIAINDEWMLKAAFAQAAPSENEINACAEFIKRTPPVLKSSSAGKVVQVSNFAIKVAEVTNESLVDNGLSPDNTQHFIDGLGRLSEALIQQARGDNGYMSLSLEKMRVAFQRYPVFEYVKVPGMDDAYLVFVMANKMEFKDIPILMKVEGRFKLGVYIADLSLEQVEEIDRALSVSGADNEHGALERFANQLRREAAEPSSANLADYIELRDLHLTRDWYFRLRQEMQSLQEGIKAQVEGLLPFDKKELIQPEHIISAIEAGGLERIHLAIGPFMHAEKRIFLILAAGRNACRVIAINSEDLSYLSVNITNKAGFIDVIRKFLRELGLDGGSNPAAEKQLELFDRWGGLWNITVDEQAEIKSSSAGVRIEVLAELKPIGDLFHLGMSTVLNEQFNILRSKLSAEHNRLDKFLQGKYLISAMGGLKDPVSLIGPFSYGGQTQVALMAMEYSDRPPRLLAIDNNSDDLSFYSVTVRSMVSLSAAISQIIDSGSLPPEVIPAWSSYFKAQAEALPDIRIETEHGSIGVHEGSRRYLVIMENAQPELHQQLIELSSVIGKEPTAEETIFRQYIRERYNSLDGATFKDMGLIKGAAANDRAFSVKAKDTDQIFIISRETAISPPSGIGRISLSLQVQDIDRIAVVKNEPKASSAGVKTADFAAVKVMATATMGDYLTGRDAGMGEDVGEAARQFEGELNAVLGRTATTEELQDLIIDILERHKDWKEIFVPIAILPYKESELVLMLINDRTFTKYRLIGVGTAKIPFLHSLFYDLFVRDEADEVVVESIITQAIDSGKIAEEAALACADYLKEIRRDVTEVRIETEDRFAVVLPRSDVYIGMMEENQPELLRELSAISSYIKDYPTASKAKILTNAARELGKGALEKVDLASMKNMGMLKVGDAENIYRIKALGSGVEFIISGSSLIPHPAQILEAIGKSPPPLYNNTIAVVSRGIRKPTPASERLLLDLRSLKAISESA